MRIHVTQRANAIMKHDLRATSVIAKELHHQQFITRDGKVRKLTIRECQCGKKFYGQRDVHCAGRQKDVAKLCPECFYQTYKKKRPKCFRFLNIRELEALKRLYEAKGCKVYTVDPSTL